MVDLSPGDFLYQSDQELFLVVVEERDESYVFAAHGWRDIDTDRVEEYTESDKSNVYKQGSIEELIEEKGGSDTKEQFNKLKQLFDVYEQADIPSEGPHEDFAFEEK